MVHDITVKERYVCSGSRSWHQALHAWCFSLFFFCWIYDKK